LPEQTQKGAAAALRPLQQLNNNKIKALLQAAAAAAAAAVAWCSQDLQEASYLHQNSSQQHTSFLQALHWRLE
jgi:hypothetical protein